MVKEKKYLTYEQCMWLLPEKSARKFRALTQCTHLYRHGQSFAIKITDWRKPKGGPKQVYDPPLAVIHPHNVAVLDTTAQAPGVGPITVGNLFAKFFGMRFFSKRDRRSSAQLWWYNGREGYKARAHAVPFANGLQIDLTTGDAINAAPTEKRRRVNAAVAKPLRDKIADWDKFATTYFRMIQEWGDRHIDLLEAAPPSFPQLDDEPSVEGLMRVIRGSTPTRLWRLISRQYYADRQIGWAQSMWSTAFEKWKERIYEEHDAYEWVPVVAKAA